MDINFDLIPLALRDFARIFPVELYLVGGACRDLIRGENPHDWDCASSLTPFRLIRWCLRNGISYYCCKSGIAHGTVTIKVAENLHVEVTTFRKDASCDGRRATVEYAKTIEEDLSRRDLTFNAIAIALSSSKVIDPFSGVKDLEEGIIRFVGSPVNRIQEDYLRILRAARFAAKFGFYVERESLAACQVEAPNLIKSVSIERITQEVEKAFPVISKFVYFLEAMGLKYLFHKNNKPWFLRRRPANIEELWYLLYEFDKISINDFCQKWRLSRAVKNYLEDLQKIKGSLPVKVSEARLIKDSLKYSENLQKYLDFWCISNWAYASDRLNEVPNLKGTDLIAKGIKGPEIGRLLKEALVAQMDRPL